MDRLVKYFSQYLGNYPMAATVGAEVETQFVEGRDALSPITLQTSQAIFRELVENGEWEIAARKGGLITELCRNGSKVLYELSRANIELSERPLAADKIIAATRRDLGCIYEAANRYGARPCAFPILREDKTVQPPYLPPSPEDLFAIPDERDAAWLELDGRAALSFLTICSAVQFTIDVPLSSAIPALNALGEALPDFLRDYPQDELWTHYIRESKAGYQRLRYGGPLYFSDLEDYCRRLAEHQVVCGTNLVPLAEVQDLNIPLFLRSVWWYFRLRRYGPRLCIEVRPLPRSSDERLEGQLESVLSVMSAC